MDLLGTEFYAGLPAIQELKVPGEGLDFAYLRRWAPRLHLADLLARALDDAGLSGAGSEV